MLRVGVRPWLSLLLIGWGVTASVFSLIHNRTTFYALRLLLGVFEAGALPAIWYHLSQFMPQDRRVFLLARLPARVYTCVLAQPSSAFALSEAVIIHTRTHMHA